MDASHPPSHDPASSDSLPGAELHRAAGAEIDNYRGARAPSSYGDAVAEAAALRAGFAVVHRTWAGGLELAGEDRGRFLNSQATCEVKALAPGSGTYGFFVSGKGRIEADVTVLATADRLLLDLPAGTERALIERLEKYKVVDRVEIARAAAAVLDCAGSHAASGLEALLGGAPPAEVLSHRPGSVAGREVLVVRERDIVAGTPRWSLRCEPSALSEVWQAVLDGGAAPAGFAAWDAVRVEAGVPVFGPDFGPNCFPQETGLGEIGVNYTKGCYLGQEVVARIHYRSGVQRRMCRLKVTRGDAAVGLTVQLDGRKVGKISSYSALEGGEKSALA
ncbi:MAG: hypothetical protein AAF725_24430, partial [Acidobacteriota bacterium]